MVRLIDIAERVGVSVMTVSKALRDDQLDVAVATRARIKAAAKEMGYTPDPNAQSLRTGSTKDRKSTRLNSSHLRLSRMPSSA